MGDQDCSFCTRAPKEVEKMVAGPHGNICDDCILVCAQIMLDKNHPSDFAVTVYKDVIANNSLRESVKSIREIAERALTQ